VDGRDIQSARSKSVPSVIEVNKISRESVEAAAQKIQSFVASMERNLNIYVDTRSGQSVIRVVDPESAQVIRQIPPEESIRLAQTVDFLASLLVHQRA
jgi:flagellar protein FlaG